MEHIHCNNCIKAKVCRDNKCEIVTCGACDGIFHKCKAEEHKLLCPSAVVPCINCCNGCEAKLPRYQLGKHLAVCPASVVVCSYEWRRWGTEKSFMHSLKPVPRDFNKQHAEQLDIALTTRDQRNLIKELNDQSITYSINPYKLSIQTAISSIRKTQRFTTLEELRFKISTFCCDQQFRREDYGTHYKNVHCDIAELLPRLEQRCPLFDAGCMFTQTSICPSKPGWKVTIAKPFGAVCVKPSEEDLHSINKSPNTSLTTMPPEVVEHVLGFLDTLSLLNMLQVNRRLHDIVFSRIKHRGVVFPIWKKKNLTECNNFLKTSWSIVEMDWRFCTSTSTVTKWLNKDTESHLSDHLKVCPYFQRVSRKVPYFAFWPDHPEVQENDVVRARLQKHVANTSSRRYVVCQNAEYRNAEGGRMELRNLPSVVAGQDKRVDLATFRPSPFSLARTTRLSLSLISKISLESIKKLQESILSLVMKATVETLPSQLIASYHYTRQVPYLLPCSFLLPHFDIVAL